MTVSNTPTVDTTSKAPSNYSPITKYGAWIVLAVVLLGAGQFDSTAQLAAAMSYLILIAALMFYGPNAFANLQTLAGQNKQTTTTGSGGTRTFPV